MVYLFCFRLKKFLKKISKFKIGKEIWSGDEEVQFIPSDHKKKLAIFHKAPKNVIEQAIEGSLNARKTWFNVPFVERASVFLKAADLLSTKYRARLCAGNFIFSSFF